MRKSYPIRMLGCLVGAQLLSIAGYSQNVYAYTPSKTARVAAASYAVYDKEDTRKQRLFSVLKELNKEKGVYFLFSEQELGTTLVNNVTEKKANITRILDEVLKNTGLTYKKINENTYVIVMADDKSGKEQGFNMNGLAVPDDVANMYGAAFAAIVGKVTSADGAPLAGVSVMIKGTKKGVFTNANGVFKIDADKGDALVFSFVGYESFEATVGDEPLNVTLKESQKQLNEVVVTALGIKKQSRSLGYSTTEVPGSNFTQSRETNLGNALTGQVAGVSVAGEATGPYGGSRVLIRGNASLSGNNQPLYVIDGVPFDNTSQGSAGQWGQQPEMGDGLSTINPDDIESIQVLKGVAASALYGYRGGNGAILITTKSGAKSHGFGIELNNNFTANRVIDNSDYQYQYGQGTLGVKPTTADAALATPYNSWGAKMDGSQAVNFLGESYAYSPYKNNFKDFFRTGVTNQTSVALTGANDKGHFRLGLSNMYLNTVIPNSNLKQQGVNFNSTYNITSKLQMSLSADYVFEQVKNRASFSDAPGNVMAVPLYAANTFDIRWLKDHRVNPDGTEWLPGTDIYFENPYYIAYNYQNKTNRNRLTGNLQLKYNILDWLYVQGQVTRDGYIFDVTNITPSGVQYTRHDGVHGGNITQYEVNYHELNSSFMVGVNKKFGGDFTFNANVGVNRQDNVNQAYGVGSVPTYNPSIAAPAPAGPFIIADYYTPNNVASKPFNLTYLHYRVNSVYGSADLGYKNFLFLSVTARNDWFSTLNVNTSSYLYPSVAASFVFSDVLKMPSWINFGKLRASYAGGSNGTSPYQNALTYGLQGYTISGQPLGYVASQAIPNAALKPVSIKEQEIGLNMQFLHNRLGLDVAVYNKKTTDDIVKLTVSPTSGYNQKVQNVGEIRNQGIELLLTGTPVKTRNFYWDVSFNFAYNKSKVLSLGGLQSIVVDGAYPRWGSEVSISNVVGLPYGQIMGYGYKRDAGGNKIFDKNGEPVPTDVMPLGSGVYKQTGGLNNELHYKNFSLAFLFDFKFGAKIYSGTNLLLYYYGLQKETLAGRDGGYVGRGVTEDGKVNTTKINAEKYFEDISAGGSDHIAEEFVYDASFIKLRSLSIGYSIPASALKNSFIKGLSVSLVGRNLATLVKHTPNIDPESSVNNTNGQGLELSGFPAVRNYGLNVNVKF
ncbi:SusC/RagA family TonB-linked outer membrane protein [Deminuibacter soli]|uniref:SusC/RagA family TonB-linked outer membrane protein n=1 Tax=Deminuibacter soli TaxID=2291815 RepID=A0A3E1NIC5_9BACT|nr:SusC/RagA family TonB-linked outer membrane protein [Deminuibacter soli]RFM27680.1 SusC/RagA family TonB-linked outer membrane protein [Deminuibacter soli]